MNKLLSFLKTSLGSVDVGHIASKLAEYSVKAWIAICRWRQLQWSPRPILFPPAATTSVQEAQEKGEPVNVIKVFEADAEDIFKLSSQHGIHLIDAGVKPVHLITILASSAINVLSDTAIANAILRPPEVDNCEWTMENPADSHTQREVGILLSPYSELLSALREVAQVELSFDNVWQTFSSFKGTNQKNQSRNLPILKLHYNNMMIDAGAQDVSPKYYDACEILLNFLVRNFSVVPASTKKGAGGDLHMSVLKSLANINGDAVISTSPPTVLPSGANINNINNHIMLAHSQFTAASPVPQLHKTRPQSSPLIRGTAVQDSASSDRCDRGAVEQQELEQKKLFREEEDVLRPSSALESSEVSRSRNTSAPPPSVNETQNIENDIVVVNIAVKEEPSLDFEQNVLCMHDEQKEDIPGIELLHGVGSKLVSGPVSFVEDTTVAPRVHDNSVETRPLSVKFNEIDNNKDAVSVSKSVSSNLSPPMKSVKSTTATLSQMKSAPAPVTKEKNEQPISMEVDLVVSAAGDLLLSWRRVEKQEKLQKQQQPKGEAGWW